MLHVFPWFRWRMPFFLFLLLFRVLHLLLPGILSTRLPHYSAYFRMKDRPCKNVIMRDLGSKPSKASNKVEVRV